jgi:predicted RNase H-like HicB family nuclease
MTEFHVIYEQAADGGWNARAVDLPVYAAGASREEAEREITVAIRLHLDVLRERGEQVPAATGVHGTVIV